MKSNQVFMTHLRTHQTTRRRFLAGCASTLLALGVPCATLADGADATHIPILIFHRVDDAPHAPEDISSAQLARLFQYLWKQDFCPVNISDIVTNRLDAVVPRGLRPIGITADDAHRSILFSKAQTSHPDQNNAVSFVDIFAASLQGHPTPPRATFFLGRVGNDRYSSVPEGYFGDIMPLREALDSIAHLPGIEFGYHTCRHVSMKRATPDAVADMVTEQMEDFTQLGVRERIAPLLAYPYGLAPSAAGIQALKRCGLQGAVLAFPGTHEFRSVSVPQCRYDGTLTTDPFFIPRVGIGAYTYALADVHQPIRYLPIDPIADFEKDVDQRAAWRRP